MSPEDALRLEVELEALITEREGMCAENAQRSFQGCAMAYPEEPFAVLADKMRALLKPKPPAPRPPAPPSPSGGERSPLAGF